MALAPGMNKKNTTFACNKSCNCYIILWNIFRYQFVTLFLWSYMNKHSFYKKAKIEYSLQLPEQQVFKSCSDRNIIHKSIIYFLEDVIQWKHFPCCWPFVLGIHGYRWIPRTKASDAEICGFLWSASEKTVELTIVKLVIWDAIAPIMTSL